MKKKSLIPGDDLIRVRVCTVYDMIKKGVAPPTHSRSARCRSLEALSQKYAEKTKFQQVSEEKDGFEVWEWREQLMEMERKMARYKDGKLIKAAPFDFYSLRYLKRAMMKRQINDSLCVIPVKVC